MENRSQKLFKSLKVYYTKEKVDKIIQIINSTDPPNKNVSLRLIDWLVTNYSRHKNVIYTLENGVTFNLHQSYKNMLKAYSKKLFDPFKRHDRVYIAIANQRQTNVIETTVAQLTFFKWAIDNEVLEYARKHRNDIKLDMDSMSRKAPRESTSKPVYNVDIKIVKRPTKEIAEKKIIN